MVEFIERYYAMNRFVEKFLIGIGNLPPSTTSEDLEAIFRVYGHIESAQVLVSFFFLF